MNKRHLRILYLVAVIGTGIAIALISARPTPAARLTPDLETAALYQAASPTPTAQAVSEAGSTDGIMLMGVVIVVIILLPILLRKSTWKK